MNPPQNHFVVNRSVGLISLFGFILTVGTLLFHFFGAYFQIQSNTGEIENHKVFVSSALITIKQNNDKTGEKIDLLTQNMFLLMGKMGVSPVRTAQVETVVRKSLTK